MDRPEEAGIDSPALSEEYVNDSMFSVRVRLYLVAYLTLLATASIVPLMLVLNRLGFRTPDFIRVIVNYISMVKIYDQRKRSGGNPLDGLNDPPRTAVRRRMVRTIVDVATADYDRWYIFGHSLGSVVAFNGLMEPDEIIPNYLDRERWNRICGTSLVYQTGIDVAAIQTTPARPTWVNSHAAVSRLELFRRLRGLLTYGCPLDKFAAIWPAKVAINNHQAALSGVEWINIYDLTDPVAGHLDSFSSPGTGSSRFEPVNLCYEASPWVLLSHIRYLTTRPRRRDQLADRSIEWLLSGGQFSRSPWFDPDSAQGWSRWAFVQTQWAVVTVVLLVFGSFSMTLLPDTIVPDSWSLGERAVVLAFGVLLVVLVVGLIGRWLVFRPDVDTSKKGVATPSHVDK